MSKRTEKAQRLEAFMRGEQMENPKTDELKERLYAAEERAYRANLENAYHRGGFPGVLEFATQDHMRQYRRLDETIEEAKSREEKFLNHEHLPKEIINMALNPSLPNGQTFSNTGVGASLFFTNGRDIHYAVIQGAFHAPLEVAQEKVVQGIVALLNLAPTIDDVKGMSIYGLTSDEIVAICQRLTLYRHVYPGLFDDKRLEEYEAAWGKISAALKAEGLQYTKGKSRRDVFKHFKVAIDRIFKHAEDRRSGVMNMVEL